MTGWYVVGGAIRDLLLGRTPRDVDFAFSGGVDAFVQALPQACKVGRSVDVWLVDGMEFRPMQGHNIQEDLRARDLTINALAVDEKGRLHAHPDALTDLRGKVLRPTARDAMRRDPARVFRVARMAAELPDFAVHEETLRQMRELGATEALAGLPPERVCREVLRAMEAPRPSRFLAVLDRGRCLEPWLTEWAGGGAVTAGPAPWHDNSVLEHAGEIMDQVAGDPLAVWMALCHDVGKVTTDPALLPHHYAHEMRGAGAAAALAARLRLPTRYRAAGALAARLHMKAGRYRTLRPGTRRDILWEVHAARLDEPFWKVVNADSGQNLSLDVARDLAIILAVHLPEPWRDRGEMSGRHMRELQCEALARAPAASIPPAGQNLRKMR